MSELLNVQEASVVVGLSVPTMNRFRTKGGGAPFYKLGGLVRYDRKELELWMRSRRYKSTSEAAA